MNTNNIKKYAPKARREFIEAVTKRLNYLGIHADNKGQLKISEAQVAGSIMQIDGNSFSARIEPSRRRLVERTQQQGFVQLAEQTAYTWFNRLCAIRYMELQGYLDHGFRVLSPSSSKGEAAFPEILNHAQDVADDLGLDRNIVVELKLAGNKDEALYRELLLGQCHKLHEAMPFLFEALDDETELLLPDNLTRTDSILRGLVDSIPESDWEQVEIIGWLYQFYISEKKDQVIGKVVKSEDIPAATQLFTPNWIVKYLVQNSVGRQWLMTYPNSGIKAQMEYYIEPAEQEPSVGAALAVITPASIDPESIKVLDPACGSGHILIEAYNVLKAIYEERGYRSRDIPKLILENNLFGLDIDDRAAQLAGFTLMMKAREDDRRVFSRDVQLNIQYLHASQGLDAEQLVLNCHAAWSSFYDTEETKSLQSIVSELIDVFQQADTFGSLIAIPKSLAQYLPTLGRALDRLAQQQADYLVNESRQQLWPLLKQALILAQRYDAVVANPPYMGGKGMNSELKAFAKKQFPDSKSDLFAMFIERGFDWCKPNGFNSMVTMQSWMFLSSYETMREKLLSQKTLNTMAHLGARAFSEISGEVVQTTAFVFHGDYFSGYKPAFFRLVDGNEEQRQTALLSGQNRFDKTVQDDFKKISGSPIAYWVSHKVRDLFDVLPKLESHSTPKQGLATGDNNKFLRTWNEVNFADISFHLKNYTESVDKNIKWVPYSKGGGERKWFGFNEQVVYWRNGGDDIRNFKDEAGNERSRFRGYDFYFHQAATWGLIASGNFSCRYRNQGFVYDIGGMSLFSDEENLHYFVGFLNSIIAFRMLRIINPTLNFQAGDIGKLPLKIQKQSEITQLTIKCIELSKLDWDSFETSWDFTKNPLIHQNQNTLSASFEQWQVQNRAAFAEMKHLEEENNRLFIEAYGLQDELTPEVPEDQITLTRADQEKDIQRLLSYAIGCMMGRYSLAEPGLIYAHAGNVDFDPSRYPSFPADEDGILPLTDQEWFKDDATNRFREFLVAVWGENTLQQNLAFVAESLTLSNFKPKKGETSLDTVRRYLSNPFYKDHLKTYKKRPIYWLFSSGKQKAFECLVYLHRYNEGTLSRMRTEYVTPLLGKYDAYAEQLQKQLDDASTTVEANRLKKERDALIKKQVELRQFDDKLKHYADRRIKLDLDDGVKVNYGKFGDLLFDVKNITGKAPEAI